MKEGRQVIARKIIIILLCALLSIGQGSPAAFALRPASSSNSSNPIDRSFLAGKSSSAGVPDTQYVSVILSPQTPQWAKDIAEVLYKDKSFSGKESYYDYSLRVFENFIHLRPEAGPVASAAALLHRADPDDLKKAMAKSRALAKGEQERVLRLVKEAGTIRCLPYFKSYKKSRYSIQNQMNMIIQLASEPDVMMLVFAEKIACLTGKLNRDQKEYIYRELVNVYAPLAERLGMIKLSNDLRNESLKAYNLEAYNSVKSKIEDRIRMRIDEADGHLKSVENKVKDALKNLGVGRNLYVVTSRVKGIYSVYEKGKGRMIEPCDLYDIFGIRVVFSDNNDIWKAGELLEKVGMSIVPGEEGSRYKTTQKLGYEAYQVRVQDKEGRFYEFQFMSKENLDIYEHSEIAHWAYKIKRQSNQKFDKDEIKWTGNFDKDFKALKGFLSKWVFVFKKVSVNGQKIVKPLRLEKDSTIADYAALRGTDLLKCDYKNGNIFHCVYDIESCKIKWSKPMRHGNQYELKTADSVEIIKDNDNLINFTNARLDIDKYAKTLRAHLCLNNIWPGSMEKSTERGLKIIKDVGFVVNPETIGKFFKPCALDLGLVGENELFAAVASTQKFFTLDDLRRRAYQNGKSIVEAMKLNVNKRPSEIKLMKAGIYLRYTSLDDFLVAIGSCKVSPKALGEAISRSSGGIEINMLKLVEDAFKSAA
ncbi:MAG: HD domain-containing protein [Candidatus Omnitrophica bacterium]|nr:HD domain-containing protein [Candidatus Omnitrophota bacterium]